MQQQGEYQYEGEQVKLPSIVEPGLIRQYLYLRKTNPTKLNSIIRSIEASEKNEETKRIALSRSLLGVQLPKLYCPDVTPCEPKHLCCHTSEDRVVVLREQKDQKSGFFYLRTCFYGVCETFFDIKQPFYKVYSKELLKVKEIALPVNKSTDVVYVPAIEGFIEQPKLVLQFVEEILKKNRVVIQLWNRYDYKNLIDVLQKIQETPSCMKTDPPICSSPVRGKLYVVPLLILIVVLYMIFSI